MKLKILEIRDRATFIPVIAIRMSSKDPTKRYYLKRLGFGEDYPLIELIRMDNEDCSYAPCKWDCNTRTMIEAHKYIVKNWSNLNNGDVIDVEYILGETETPKVSERFNV